MSFGTSSSTNYGSGKGWSETIHKTHLISPSEIGKLFARTSLPDKPGLMLALIPGRNPAIFNKTNYFHDPQFKSLFDPHPDHKPPLTIQEIKELPPPAPAPKPAPRELDTSSLSWSYHQPPWLMAFLTAILFGLGMGMGITGARPSAGGGFAAAIFWFVVMWPVASWGKKRAFEKLRKEQGL